MRIVNKKYRVSNKINKKIVLISDIHYSSKSDIKILNKVLNKIKKVNPNYICITGDTLENHTVFDFELLLDWLKQLACITKVIMVLGNHEYYYNKKNKIYKLNHDYFKQIKKINNLYFLDNDNIILDNINFIGVNLPISYYMFSGESVDVFLKNIKSIKTYKKYYNVLLCHSPVCVCKKEVITKLDVDLVLCGHMHGGMIPNIFRFVFKNRGLISPLKEILPKNVYGNISIDNKNIIITSGIKVLSSRKFNLVHNIYCAEIVEINL